MARVVFVTWGSLGDLHPYLALAQELTRRGHDVAVATLGVWRRNVEAAGVAFRPLRPNVSEDDPGARELIRRLLDPRDGSEHLFTRVFAPCVRETFEDTLVAAHDADLLVSHQVPLTTPTVAERSGVRWVSGELLPMGFMSAYDPGTPPQAPWLHRVAAAHPALGRTYMRIGRAVARPWVEHVHALRAELGMARGANPLFGGQHSPWLVLGLFSRLLARPQPDFPPQARITGFPFDDAAAPRALDSSLERFLAGGEPPIVFTLGSSAVWIADDFYRVSIEAATRLGRRALLLAGEQAERLRATVPETIGVFDYVPHHLVMPRASVVVHQGGIGTTGQALRSGRPMLVVPFGQDQPDNARRCRRLGVARAIARPRYSVDRAVRDLSVLLDDPAYARRAADVGEEVRAERGTETACDEIERVLKA